MNVFFGIVGFFGMVVFIVIALVALVKKKGGAKKYFICAGISFVLLAFGISITELDEEAAPVATEVEAEEPKAEEDEKAAEAKAKEEEAKAEAEKQKAAEEKAAADKAKQEADAKAAAEKKEAEEAQAKQAAAEKAAAEKALDAEGISKAEFNEIQNGMTYEEVVSIIGVEGELLSEVGEKGTQFYTVMYVWYGETGLGANANALFQGGKLNSKAQFGLE